MLVRCLAMMRGGGETRHLAWARELRELGVRVDVITGAPLLGSPRYRIDPSIDATIVKTPYTRDFVYRNQNRRGFGRLTSSVLHADEELFCRAAWRRIETRREKPDVVHAHALYQAARLKTSGIPVVINIPGEPHARYEGDLQKADALVADGWAAQHLAAAVGRPILSVPKGVDAALFEPDGPSVRDALRLGTKMVVIAVARLVPLKNVALLVDAMALVRARLPRTHLLVVGDGPERDRLRARAGELDLLDAVTFTGSVPHGETAPLYRSADVFALSSDFDNSPNAVLEAMASGLPVVATDSGGVREFVATPDGGLIVPKRDPQALASAIESLLRDPERRRTAGAFNRRRAAHDFSWRTSAEHLLDVYRRVVRDAGGDAARASA